MYIDELTKIVKGRILTKKSSKKVGSFSIDTRTMKKGDVFLALTSGRTDGHSYIKEAIRKKASCILVSKEVFFETNIPIILVDSVEQALWKIGEAYRQKNPIFYIGITGSNGKTTTKELLYTVLSRKYAVLKSEKNYNNHIGVPLTLTRLNEEQEIALIEMGMNHIGEIERLSKLVKPNLSLITNIGSSHIGNLGSKKNIYKAKMEIVKGMDNGLLLVNGDDVYLKKVHSTKQVDVIHCGYNSTYALKPRHVKATMEGLFFTLSYQNKTYDFKIPVLGKHLLVDILLVIETALLLGINMEEIQKALVNYKTVEKRMEYTKKGEYAILNDAYNASYDSFVGIIDLVKEEQRDKIFVIGDMLELGTFSTIYHKKLQKKLRKLKKCEILLIGKEAKKIKRKNWKHFETNHEVSTYLKSIDLKNKLIIFKGSRKMRLEEIIQTL